MCRLAVYGGVENFTPLCRVLTDLEKSAGGDGNGYYNLKTEDLYKGLRVTTGEIAFDSFGREGIHLFHTRIATAGGLSSTLNHPFRAGDYVLMHNGHWDWYYEYAYGGEESDTETAASLVSMYGPGILLDEEFDFSGIWIAAGKGKVYVIDRGYNQFFFQFLKRGGFFHASERISHMAVSKQYETQQDQVYEIFPDGSYQLNWTLDEVPLPAPMYTTTQDRKWEQYYNYYKNSGSYKKHDFGIKNTVAPHHVPPKGKVAPSDPKVNEGDELEVKELGGTVTQTILGDTVEYSDGKSVISYPKIHELTDKDWESVMILVENEQWEYIDAIDHILTVKEKSGAAAYQLQLPPELKNHGAPFGVDTEVTPDGEVIYRDKETGMELISKPTPFSDD